MQGKKYVVIRTQIIYFWIHEPVSAKKLPNNSQRMRQSSKKNKTTSVFIPRKQTLALSLPVSQQTKNRKHPSQQAKAFDGT
ncbi:hypothetical protein CEXT_329571 [Caerostris extrusa]|uniref:Uncharacterized protein n=1 Tax=Caerostris extrusa TaxID=172846 RepID=A0AAV4S836_CAEEX|nr:hypothetical protein CEXT_329571 [Caerostris extrusa]